MKVKCTFEKCPRHFTSQKDMLQHKKEDPDHVYCKRCDFDCADDLDFFIHQLMSKKHIACPICGQEFKSAGGRDRHVELTHPSKQHLTCPACATVFTAASALMLHVERDECNVLKEETFARHRLEKQLEQEAWADALEPGHKFTLATFSEIGTETQDGGVWLPSSDAQFPTFTSRPNATETSNSPSLMTFNDDTVDDEPEYVKQQRQRLANLGVSDTAWNSPQEAAKLLFPGMKTPHAHWPSLDGNKLDERGSFPEFFDENTATLTPSQTNSTQTTFSSSTTIPTTARTSYDPNAHIQTSHSNLLPPSTGKPNKSFDVARYLNPISHKYECPALSCRRKYDTEKEFIKHMDDKDLHPVKVRCPRCMKLFGSTYAFTAHAESASRKCHIRYSSDYDTILRQMTGGLIGVNGQLEDGAIRYEQKEPEFW